MCWRARGRQHLSAAFRQAVAPALAGAALPAPCTDMSAPRQGGERRAWMIQPSFLCMLHW